MIWRQSFLSGQQSPLYDTLCEHCIGNLHEAGNVGTLDVVDLTVGLGTVLNSGVVDVAHNAAQTLVDFFSAPAEPH